MKKTIFTLAILCSAIVGRAQVTDEQSAILQNGDNAQIFYGADALKEAVEAAPDRGATITLSAGTFNGTTITKCVNIYGAGWVEEKTPKNNENPADNSILPTIINSLLELNVPEALAAPHNFHIEGMRFNGGLTTARESSPIDGLEVVKCLFVTDVGDSHTDCIDKEHKNVHFIQCCLTGAHLLNAYYEMTFDNCWMELYYWAANNRAGILHTSKEGGSLVFNHCVMNIASTTVHSKFQCFNSILVAGGGGQYTNCFIRGEGLDASYLNSTNNYFGTDWTKVFSDAGGIGYSDTRTFELTDEAKATYIGSDGTEIGINGGNYPWNKTPHTPLVKDLKLSIDGKQLKVEYNAETR